MSEKNPYESSNVIDVDDRLDWVSYQIFRPISDYIVQNTNYSKYINTTIDKPTRYYISRIFFDGLLSLFLILVLLNLLFTLISAGTEIVEAITSVIQLSSVLVLFAEFIRYGVSIILFAVEESTGFILSELSLSEILDYIVNLVIEYPILQPIVGALIGIQTAISESLSQLLPQVSLEGVTIIPEDLGIISSIEEALDIKVTPVLIRSIISFVITPMIAFLYIGYKLYYPIYIANERKRSVDKKLPQSVLFLYALTKGGLDIGRAMQELGESDETYGEMANVFTDITRRAKYSNGDLRESLIKETKNTNHEDLEDFLYGLVSAMDTGSNTVRYLELQTEEFLEQKREEQESYFSFLDILSEMFVILFVVAPIFILIIQLVSAMTGGFSRPITQLVPYIFVPAGGFVISALLYVIGTSTSGEVGIRLPESMHQKRYRSETGESLREEDTFVDKFVDNVFNNISENPYYSLLFTMPIIFVYYSIMVQLNVIPLNIEGITENMLQVTIYGYYIPLVIIIGPWTYLYEIYRRKKERINRQLPVLLENVKEANRRGLTLQESFEAASTTDSTELYQKLSDAINKSSITANLNRALIEFSNELRVPRVSEAISLLTKANRVSADVSQAVETIATDFNELYKIQRTRKQKAREYVVVVFVSILISALLIISLDIVFFTFITEQTAAAAQNTQVDVLSDIPSQFFRRVFLHTLMTVSLVSGFVAGIMENNNPQNGFKYILIFTTITIFAYTLQSVLL